eukprot:315520-Amphidinium_carterae.1
MGCGFVARQGYASDGRLFETCCTGKVAEHRCVLEIMSLGSLVHSRLGLLDVLFPGCETMQQHDDSCAQLRAEGLIAPSTDSDAQGRPVTNHGADADIAYRSFLAPLS